MLKFIKSSSALPWVCMGDFNEVLHRSEHVGVQERSNAQIAGFREMVDVCGLRDLGYEGRSWTFEKKVAGGMHCRVRLDGALASADWSARFPSAVVQNLLATTSDHGPILLGWAQRQEQRRMRNRFRYELMWEEHEQFAPMLSQVWQQGGEATSVIELSSKLANMSTQLKVWNKGTFGSVKLELSKLKAELEVMQADP